MGLFPVLFVIFRKTVNPISLNSLAEFGGSSLKALGGDAFRNLANNNNNNKLK